MTDREKIRLAMEREQQRGMLLRSVAHDEVRSLPFGGWKPFGRHYDVLSDDERKKLASDISEIVWLTDLVENITNGRTLN